MLVPEPQRNECAVSALHTDEVGDRAIQRTVDAGLKERIEGLQAEIERSQAAIDGKSSQRNAADALFNFRS